MVAAVPSPLVNSEFPTSRAWRSGHLQTVRNRIVPGSFDLALYGTSRSIQVPMNDGSGDEIAVQLHRSTMPTRPNSSGGLVMLVHGLGGSGESEYMKSATFGLLHDGFNVARVDLRGAGQSAATCTLLYHAGRTQDLRAVLGCLAVQPEAIENEAGGIRLAAMGFSLGGSMTLKLLGEPSEVPLFGGVAVSAPLDLVAGSAYLRRAGLGTYEKVLMAGLKRQVLRPAVGSRQHVCASERLAVGRARTLEQFDDVLTAPRNGWRDAAQYYAVNSCNQYLQSIATPTLVIHSLDDPMIPSMPYKAVDWKALEEAGFVDRRISARGGHVGFHQSQTQLPWYVGQATTFFSAN